MAWKNCENCQGAGTTYNWGTNESKSCYPCGNTGRIWVADPVPVKPQSSSKPINQPTQQHAKSDSRKNVQWGVATIVFLICTYYSFSFAGEKIYIALGASLVVSWFAFRYFKAIIWIAAIGGLVWYFTKY